jgi:sigma-B regulation protein RsbU (phosphoserine phosphatase)
LQVANSGLPRPLHLRDGKFAEIPVTGLPIGLFSTATYDGSNLRAKPGDVFLFFSDGITDATSSAGNMFGRGRLEKVVLKNANRSADEIAQAIFDAVSEHARGVEAFDDQTIVVLKVNGQPAKK